MLGHSFLNGGPRLTGLSPAVLDIIAGKEDTNQLAPQDSPDIDVREIVTLLTNKDPLSPADKHNVVELCVAWDLPTAVNDTNRNWLAEKILHHSMILEQVIWPSKDSSDSEQEWNIEQQCSALAFFRQYVEKDNSEKLKYLIKFWVGWVVFPQHLYIEVISGLLPKSKTCLETLQIPGHHTAYKDFEEALEAAVHTADTGFGFI
ncbi:uncharacterized protein LOC114566707 [Perca flavescens]|uniref:uncharacterized protein LOC114566707 n=1 Tax=Perca flavescens TaxID=8167 RepID=UPI00106E255B|nr:uncharacterized protein LOC114566707 [Perca flavescens]